MRRIVGAELEEIERQMAEGQRSIEQRGERAFADGDVDLWLGSYDNMLGLRLVFDRRDDLLARGLYEKALVQAYTMVRENTLHVPESVVREMFALADRRRLFAAGDLKPCLGPWEVYRGVSGHGRARRVNGLSWSFSLNLACWFALRNELAAPAILHRVVTDDEVYYFSSQRSEFEAVCLPSPTPPRRHRIGVEEMHKRRAELLERWKAEEKAKPTH